MAWEILFCASRRIAFYIIQEKSTTYFGVVFTCELSTLLRALIYFGYMEKRKIYITKLKNYMYIGAF